MTDSNPRWATGGAIEEKGRAQKVFCIKDVDLLWNNIWLITGFDEITIIKQVNELKVHFQTLYIILNCDIHVMLKITERKIK